MANKSNGHLDPGTPRRQKSISGCKCLLYSTVTLILVSLAILLVYLATGLWAVLFTPHKHLYHNTTLEQVADRAVVVRPLVDREQTFDLAATVWLRTSRGRHQVDSDRGGAKEEQEDENPEREEDSQRLVEEALFSDVIFHGVRLKDNNLRTTVNFTVPTDIFREANLTNYDLRASVMLIPTDPSLVDFVTNYSSHIPNNLSVLPVRSWRFPLGYRIYHDKTLADRALESFGVSVPLVQFHGVPSRCAPLTPGETPDLSKDEVDEAQADSSEKLEELAPSPSLESISRKLVRIKHPYIVSRTQIRVLDEVNLFERKSYDKAHKELQKTPCALIRPGWYSCKRLYRSNGNWETRMELEIPDKTTGEMSTEWAYAPFISLSKNGFVSKDLIPIPVNRDNCTRGNVKEPETPMIERDYVDVTWKVSYSGYSPSKMNAAEMIDETERQFMFNDTMDVSTDARDGLELANGLLGHRLSEDIHPRRQMFIETLFLVLDFTTFCLRIRYWFTRRSTASISILGTAFMAVSSILGVVNTFLDPAHSKIGTLALIATVLYTSVAFLAIPLMQLKTVLRIEFDWSKSWIPRVYRVNATHSERASARLEAQTGWRVQAVLFFSVLAIYHFLAPHKYILIPATNPISQPAKSDHDIVPSSVLIAMRVVGSILQNILNWRSRTYAGGYRITAAVTLMYYPIIFTVFSPALIGRLDSRGPMDADLLVLLALTLVDAWQALTMPSVKEMLEEGHVE